MSYLTFLCLKFCISKIEVIIIAPTLQDCRTDCIECVKSGHQKGSGDPRYVTAKSSQGRARDRMGRQWWPERITSRFLAGGIRVPFTEI